MMEPRLEELRALKLNAMVAAWLGQRTDAAACDLDFDARLALLVEAEMLARDNKRLQKLLHDAKFRIPGACIEDLEFSAKRELNRALVRQLAVGGWIGEPCSSSEVYARPFRGKTNPRMHQETPFFMEPVSVP